MPATLFILSDGNVGKIDDFSLGNLHPVYVPFGRPDAANVGIVAFSVRRHEAKPELLQAFGRLENLAQDVSVEVELLLGGNLINADRLDLPAGESRGVAFDLGEVDSGELRLRVTTKDDLALDNEAWTVVNRPRRAKVLLVTPGNELLEYALTTAAAGELAEVTVETPAFLDQPAYEQQAAVGAFDLVIFDRCGPKTMPQANTLSIGHVPPVEGWKAGSRVRGPQIIDTDPAHPLMQWLNLGDVALADGTPLVVPPGGRTLIDSQAGPMFAIAPRERFEDAVLGFVLVDQQVHDGQTERYVGTNCRSAQPAVCAERLEYRRRRTARSGNGPARRADNLPPQAAEIRNF